jgi:carbonic anhydrase/acetyltransferase-like protein (isoleucine patch superfamily)
VVMGIPGKIKPLRDDQLARIRRTAQSYVELKERYLEHAREQAQDQ